MQAATLTLLLSAAALRLHHVGVWSWAAPGIVVRQAVACLMVFTLASFTSYSNHSLACSSLLEVSSLHHYQVKVVAALKNDGNFSFSHTSTVTPALGHFIFWHAF